MQQVTPDIQVWIKIYNRRMHASSNFEVDRRRDLCNRMFCDDKRQLEYETRRLPEK